MSRSRTRAAGIATAALLALSPAAPVLSSAEAFAATHAPSHVTAHKLTWSKPRVAYNGTNFPGSLSCVTAKFCVSVDESGNVHVFNGRRWRAPVPLGINYADNVAVSCASTRFCMAGDTYGKYSVYNGATWSALRQDSVQVNPLTAISCTGPAFCAAVGRGSFTATTYHGTSWTAPATIESSANGLDAISCVTRRFCIAVDGSGNVLRYNGSSWSAPKNVDRKTPYLTSVSCASTKFCAAVDSVGDLLTYDGTSWTRPKMIDRFAGHFLTAISCLRKTNLCVTMDTRGNIQQTRGDKVIYRERVKPFYYDAALSCATTSLCVAVNEGGEATIGR